MTHGRRRIPRPVPLLGWLALGLALGLSADPALAQESAPAEPSLPVSARTTDNPNVSLADLRLLVKPLSREELVVEAESWQARLRDVVQAIVTGRIAAGDNPSDAQEQELIDLSMTKSQLIQRFHVVIEELKLKGGEAASYEAYLAAQRGSLLGLTNPSALSATVSSWLLAPEGGQRWFWNIIRFAGMILFAYLLALFVARLVRHALERTPRVSQLLTKFINSCVRQAVLAVGILIALTALEVDITPILAAVGAAGFVIAFALQDTLSNFASGMLILAYRPFDEGDSVDAAGVSGKVDSVSLFNTRIRTFDNKLMIIPNNDIWGGTITNATASQTRRVDLVFGIAYHDDISQAREVLESLLNEHPLVLPEPAPLVRLHELADSTMKFIVRPWVKTDDYWTVYWEITEQVKRAFDQAGITIPFPQREVHLHPADGSPAAR